MIPSTVVGQVTGTGAIINVVIGFKPDYLKVVNRTTGSQLEYFRAATTAVGSRKTVVAGTVTMVTGAASLDAYGSGSTTGEGFVIPVDAQVNVAAQIIDYMAIRSGPGSK